MNRTNMPMQMKGRMKKKMMSGGGGPLKMVTNKQGKRVPFYAADGIGKMKKGGKVKGFKTGDAVKPPKTLTKAMIEAAKDANKKGKELPKNVIKAAKKIANRVPPKPPGEMPTSVRMNKTNRGKIQESLGKSVETGSDKPFMGTKGLDVSNRKGMTDLTSRKKGGPIMKMKGGGNIKSKNGSKGGKKGGKTRGSGIAMKGVRPAKMVTMKGSK
jgi:hypothetical protein